MLLLIIIQLKTLFILCIKNKAADGKIEAVQIFINKPTESSTTNHIWTKIQYSVSYKEHGENHTDTKTIYEEDAFATKQELLDSL